MIQVPSFTIIIYFIIFLQLTVDAYDKATPDIWGSATILINVRRNENKPVFNEVHYVASINTSLAQCVPIVTVAAEDTDGVSFFVFSY